MTEEESRIYQEISEKFKELVDQDKGIQSLAEKIANGKATYQDAWDYANRIGKAGSKAMLSQVDELVSDGIDGYESIMEGLYECYDASAAYAAAVQTIQNQKAGVGIKGLQADFDKDRASGIAHLGSNAEDATSAARYLGTPVEHFTENVVGDTIKANEEFQYQSGLNPKIKRTSSGQCCQWCDEIAGIYDYPAPDEVYRRHQNCNCLVEYYPGNGLKQNVHTKRWREAERTPNQILTAAKVGKEEKERNQFHKSRTFFTRADPMADAFGPGIESNPEEIANFVDEIKRSGVELIVRKTEAMGYSPGLRPGEPGQFIIWEKASYSAWCHEMQHMYDDRNAGWLGMRCLEDPDLVYEREARAYGVEIALARSAGRRDIEELLRRNLEQERRTIFGEE